MGRREKLLFRVRRKPAAIWLAAHADAARSGMPGTACVRLDRSAPARDRLRTDGKSFAVDGVPVARLTAVSHC